MSHVTKKFRFFADALSIMGKIVAASTLSVFGLVSGAQAAPLPGPNFSDAFSTFSAPFEFIVVPGSGAPDLKEFRYMITENAKEPAGVLTCQNGTVLANQNDPNGFGRLMFPPILPPRTTRNMVTSTISVISCSTIPGNDSPVAWVWFEYQAGQLTAPTILPASKSFNATLTLSVTQGAGSVTSEFKEFRYTKTTTTTPPAAPANCTSGTAVPSNGQISIAATTSVSVIACGKTTGNKSSATTATYTLDKIAPTLAVTGPFGIDGTTPLALAKNASTIKYKLTFVGADTIPSNSELASKISLTPSGAGTIAVTGSGTTERTVTLTNVTGNGAAVKIAIASGTAADSAGNQSIANSTAKTFVLDNTAPTKNSISINKAAAYTNSTAATLALGATGASQMYITNTAGCTSDGSYEDYATSKSWTLGQTNGTATVYVKFKDAAGNEGDCINDTIIHDNTLPTFTVSGPSQADAKATSSVSYTVTYSGATKAITLAPKDITLNATGVGSGPVASGTLKVIPDPGVGCKPGPCSVAPDPMKRFVTLSGFKNNGTLGITIKANSASDLAGNFAAAGNSASATFNVDTGIPTITVSDPSLANAKADSTVTYTVTYNGVTGVTLANSHLTLIKTGTANASFDVSGTGTSGTVTRIVTLNNFTGNGTIKIAILKDTATDTAGNLSAAPPATKTFIVDTTAPGAPVLPASKTFNTAFTAKATKAAAADTSLKELRYATASGTSVTAPANCTSGTMLSSGGTIPIPAATTSVAVIACDQAGNKSAATTATYTFDDGPPTISVSAPSVTSATTTTPSVTYTVTYAGADKISLKSADISRVFTGNAWTNLAPTVSMDTALPPDPMKRIVTLKSFRGIGTLAISIAARTASDNAGNYAAASSPAISATFNITSGSGNGSTTPTPTPTPDTTPPPAPTVTANTSFTATFNASISVTASDFAKFRYALDSVSTITCGTTASAVLASTSKTLTVSIASGGNKVLRVIACDTSGNASTATARSYTYVAPTPTPTPDTTPPSAPTVTANTSFTTTFNTSISVTASDFAKFRYALDSISVLTCATTASSVLTSTSNPLTVSITSGANRVLQAIACDTSGNASSATTRSYTYVAPTPMPTPTPTPTPTSTGANLVYLQRLFLGYSDFGNLSLQSGDGTAALPITGYAGKGNVLDFLVTESGTLTYNLTASMSSNDLGVLTRLRPQTSTSITVTQSTQIATSNWQPTANVTGTTPVEVGDIIRIYQGFDYYGDGSQGGNLDRFIINSLYVSATATKNKFIEFYSLNSGYQTPSSARSGLGTLASPISGYAGLQNALRFMITETGTLNYNLTASMGGWDVGYLKKVVLSTNTTTPIATANGPTTNVTGTISVVEGDVIEVSHYFDNDGNGGGSNRFNINSMYVTPSTTATSSSSSTGGSSGSSSGGSSGGYDMGSSSSGSSSGGIGYPTCDCSLNATMYPHCDSGAMTSTWQSMSCGGSSSSGSSSGGYDMGSGSSSSSSTSTGDSSSSSSTGGTSSTAAPSNFVVTTTSTDVCQDDCWIRNHTFSWTAPSGNNSTLLHYEVSTPVAPLNWFIRYNYRTGYYEYNLSPEDHLYLRVLPPSQTTHFNSSTTSTSNFRLRAVYGYRITDPDCDGLCVEVPTSYSDYVYPTSPSGSSLFIDTTPAAIKSFGGLMWSNKRPNATLQGAKDHCNTLNYGGVTGWRLPTVDELIAAYGNGIYGTANVNWMTTSQMNDYFWSPRANNIYGYAFLVNLANGVSTSLFEAIPNAVVCVK